MIAAVYARKSTEQQGADPDAKSVDRQVENARAFAAAKGWRVPMAHVYTDDAVSGAETRKLVNRQRLLDVLAGTGAPPFQVLIMRDASRFSRRDGDEAFGELKRLAQRGVTVWFYQDGTAFEYGNFAANITGIVRAEMNAEYRRQIAKWTREAMVRKAKAGHVTGGRVFGYDNVKVDGHTERRLNETEADVVRRIFALSSAGTGYTRIAKQLNADGAVAPRAQRGRPTAWSPSSVYEVLHRPLYRGEVVWNKTRKRDAEGKTAVTARPEAEWLHHDHPELRIVPEELWATAQTRLLRISTQLSSVSTARGHQVRRRRDVDSKYFLAGFARCATCGGTMATMSRRTGTGRPRAFVYGCMAHAKRGATVCDNALVLPVERVDEAVRSKLLAEVLRPAVVKAIIDGVFEALRPTAITKNLGALTKDLRALDVKIANLTAAVEDGAAVGPLVARLTARQAERETLLAAIAAAQAVGQLTVDRRTVERKVLERLSCWQSLLDGDIGARRQFLREVLDGPIQFAPDGRQYRFAGADNRGRIIAGLAGLPPVSTFCGVPTGIRTRVSALKGPRPRPLDDGDSLARPSIIPRSCAAAFGTVGDPKPSDGFY
jgi:site-specific DNA recombinase